MNLFSKYLTVWVLLCIALGVIIGTIFPSFTELLNIEFAHINILIVVLIWVMIYPMMLKIDFTSVKNVTTKPKGIVVTTSVNWLIKPFTMYLIAYLFFIIIYRYYRRRACKRVFSWGRIIRRSTVYGDGLCLESSC